VLLCLCGNASAVIIGLGYDVQGNLSIKNGQSYQFDLGNRLRQATSLERYRYDSLVAAKVDACGASVCYQHADARGSPVAETNERAAAVARTAYTPYGSSIGAAKDGMRYAGHVMDGSTGLTYMQQL